MGSVGTGCAGTLSVFVLCCADGGRVDIGGRIDVSGVNGGAVSLIGAGGVTLESTSSIDAHADGYGAGDTRSAPGGSMRCSRKCSNAAIRNSSASGFGETTRSLNHSTNAGSSST